MDLLIKIAEFDLTPYVIKGTYNINKEDVYKELEDANWTKHRFSPRTKVSGQFDVCLINRDVYDAFIAALTLGKRNGGYYLCTATTNNTLEQINGNFFIDFAPSRNKTFTGTEVFEAFTIKMEER